MKPFQPDSAAAAFAPTEIGDTESGVCRPGRVYAGEYLVKAMIGQGGMGEVYLVEHQTLHADFALKVLRPEYHQRPDIIARFRDESRALWELNHPSFVRVHHAGEDDEIGPYIVMEVLRGETLTRLLATKPRLPLEEALPILIEVAEAAQVMHDLGIIHRDLKPDNVFLTLGPDRRRGLKLLDLGIAKIAKYGQPSTAEDRVIGTGRYMSPEHIQGQKLTPAVDVYALGHIAYEILAGRHAFGANHVGEPGHLDYCVWHLNAEPEPLPELLPQCPADLWSAVRQAIAKRTSERFQSMSAFAKALRVVLDAHLAAKARGGTEQMRQVDADSGETIEEILSRAGPGGLGAAPSGERPRPLARGGTVTAEAGTVRDPISKGVGLRAALPQATIRLPDAEPTLERVVSPAGRGTLRMEGSTPAPSPPSAPVHPTVASAALPAGPILRPEPLVRTVAPTPPMAQPVARALGPTHAAHAPRRSGRSGRVMAVAVAVLVVVAVALVAYTTVVGRP